VKAVLVVVTPSVQMDITRGTGVLITLNSGRKMQLVLFDGKI